MSLNGTIKLACAISCILLLSSATALAETTWNVLERFGLAGSWSISCAQPANPKSFQTIFSKGSKGRAIREIDYGAGYPILLTIVKDAQMISPSKLKIRVRNADPNWGKTNNTTHDVVMLKESNPQTNETIRTRVISSVLGDGTVLVKDGILLSIGKPSRWNNKCRSAMS